MEAKKSPRFDLARIYALNVKEFYDLYIADAKCIAKRIKNEESVLEEGLEGYKEYKTRVKYRVIPFIW